MSNLLKDNKNLMLEYNFKKNKEIDLDKLTLGSSKKICWKCSECGNEWEATPKNRNRGTGCPVCGLKKRKMNHNKALIDKRGSLYDNRPDLIEEWNYEKNYPLTPKDVTIGSKKKVWWKCKNGHEWEATVQNRSSGSNCIYCTGQMALIGENDLVTTNPELIEEWDYEKNGDLKPENYKAGSNISVWWRCELGHSWKTTINHRTGGTGCPKCYSEYGTSFPEQAICYYLSKVTNVENRQKLFDQEVDIYLPDFKIGFEYDGLYYHDNENSRKKEKRKNQILEENGIVLYRIKEFDKACFDINNKIIYCIIDKNYYYLEEVIKYISNILELKIENVKISDDRMKIYKQYVKFIKDNNLSIKCPKLTVEWDYEKNQGLSPEYFSVGSNKKVWWKCSKCGSSYESTINHRIEGTGCSYCSGKKVNSTNSLKTKYPELSKYWDYEKNDDVPDNTYYSSRKKVWWKCSKCNKSFEAAVCTRIRAKYYTCAECMHLIIGNENRKKSLKNGSLLDNRPDLAKEWNYEKNIDLTPNNVSCGSGKLVWWRCKICGNEWEAKIFNRSNGTGCPKCSKRRMSNVKK